MDKADVDEIVSMLRSARYTGRALPEMVAEEIDNYRKCIRGYEARSAECAAAGRQYMAERYRTSAQRSANHLERVLRLHDQFASWRTDRAVVPDGARAPRLTDP